MNPISKALATVLFGVLFTGTSVLAQAVNTDYDHSVNFLKYKTYNVQKVHATDSGVEDRLVIALDRDLQARYLHPDTNNPDLLIAIVEANKDTSEYTNFYSGLSGLSWERGWGSGFMDGTNMVGDIPAGTLVLDMWDAKTKKLVWRGTITEPASVTGDKEADQKMDKAVSQVLSKFPPKFKK